jgi:hypothetical protein
VTTIVLHGESGTAQITLQAGVRLKLVGAALSAGGPVLASLQDGKWCLGSAAFKRITCEGLIHVEFQGKGSSHTFGPLRELTIGGAVISGDGLLAHYHPLDELWSFNDDLEAPDYAQRRLSALGLAAGVR